MGWLIIGALLGATGFWFSSWVRARKIGIPWYVWIFIGLAVLMGALTAMDYDTLTMAMEPATAEAILWLFGGPALISALIAIGLVWWQNRKTISAPTER